MSLYGQAKVKNWRYKLKGDFHFVHFPSPIRNVDDHHHLMGVTKPRHMIYLHSYGGEAPFFEALSQGKLLGSRCDNPDCEFQGTMYQPFRIHCPDCLARCTTVDMTELAKTKGFIHTFMICERSGAFNTLDKPIKFVNVEFEGVSTILMSYLSVGEPKIGTRVIPIFKKFDPTYTITDLSWVVEGAREDQLPSGFCF
jgi:uncharacterized OB-fold protein